MKEATQLRDLVSICTTISHTPCGHDVCFNCYILQIITEDWNKRFSVFQTETSSSSDHPLRTNLSLIVLFLFILSLLHFLSFGVSFIYTVTFSGERDLLLHLMLRLNSAKVNKISTALIAILTVEVNWTSEKLQLDDELKYYFKVFISHVVNEKLHPCSHL